jgi:hypothetical protein
MTEFDRLMAVHTFGPVRLIKEILPDCVPPRAGTS